MAGERLGHMLSSLSEVRSDPYYIPNLDEISTYSEIFPTPLDMLSVPVKATAYMNMARMGFYGGKSLGLLSSLKRPFTSKRLKWHYEATHVKGIMGRAIRGPESTSMFSIRGWQSRIRYYLGENVQKVMEPLDRKTMREGLIYKGKDISNLKGIAKGDTGTIRPTLLERWLVRPSKLESLVSTIDPTAVGKLGGAEKLTDEFIRGMYSYSPTGADRFRKVAAYPKNIGAKVTKFAKDVIGQAPLPIDKAIAISGKPKISGAATKNEMMERFIKYQEERYITPWNIIKGESTKASTKWGKRWELAKELISPREGARKFSPWTTRSRTGAMMVSGGEDVLNNVMRKVIDAERLASPGVKTMTADHLVGMWRRHQWARFAKVSGTAFVGVSLAAELVKGMYKTTAEAMTRGAATLGRLGGTEFGSGEVLQNSRLATERQRAVEAISSAQMNARTLMGNEAAMYHT